MCDAMTDDHRLLLCLASQQHRPATVAKTLAADKSHGRDINCCLGAIDYNHWLVVVFPFSRGGVSFGPWVRSPLLYHWCMIPVNYYYLYRQLGLLWSWTEVIISHSHVESNWIEIEGQREL